MNLLSMISAAAILLMASAAMAQQPRVPKLTSPSPVLHTQTPAATHFTPPSLTTPNVTPEMWVYSQEQRRHDDPAQAVRRKAEIKADQRLSRLSAMKWYGFSNARPQASVTPFTSVYSPTWVGNGLDRYDWVRGGYTILIDRTDE